MKSEDILSSGSSGIKKSICFYIQIDFICFNIYIMILKYRRFLESQQLKPTVGEVKEYFSEILQDFCDNNRYDVKFSLICNHWKKPSDDDEINWIKVYIKCNTGFESESPFTTKDLYPTIKLLLDWSIKEGSKVIEYELTKTHITGKEVIRIISDEDEKNPMQDTYVISNPVINPNNFETEYVNNTYSVLIEWPEK
jgi:hypothetical protein